MTKQSGSPFYKITMAQAEVEMAVAHPELHSDEQVRELLREAHEAMTYLMAFRNIVNALVGFDADPRVVVVGYADEEAMRQYVEDGEE